MEYSLQFILVLFGLISVSYVLMITSQKDSDVIIEIKRRLKILEPNVSFYLTENKLTNSTFTMNKHSIYLCTKTKDINTLMYVAIHELAHIKTSTYGHDSEFVKTFKELLLKAVQLGLWEPVNYSLNPQAYCDTVVKDNLYHSN